MTPSRPKKLNAGATTASFSGEILVASKIVDYLSSGLYHSPAACLKELVNNSYDADAKHVRLYVQPDADRIVVADDGFGMDRADFERHFRRIAETHKRDRKQKTPCGRPLIGKIGIGFIAANEICDIMELESTKKGSSELIRVKIDFAKMREPDANRRRPDGDVAKGDYSGTTHKAPKSHHYTNIFLSQVRGDAKRILVGERGPDSQGRAATTLYGRSAASFEKQLVDPPLTSWSDLDLYSETLLQVALNVPVQYHENWLPRGMKALVDDLVEETADLDFRVDYDGMELRKPVLLRPPANHACFIERLDFKSKRVSATGYFYVQHGTIRPRELSGVLIRIRHAAVGEYDDSFMGFPTSRGPLFQRWISGEVWASDELEEALNIDRRTLRISHPAYVELQEQIHSKLAYVLQRARKELYSRGKKARDAEQTARAVEELTEVLRELRPILGPAALGEIQRRWEFAAKSTAGRRRLKRKLSLPSLYRFVAESCSEVLGPSEARAVLKELTRRLQG